MNYTEFRALQPVSAEAMAEIVGGREYARACQSARQQDIGRPIGRKTERSLPTVGRRMVKEAPRNVDKSIAQQGKGTVHRYHWERTLTDKSADFVKGVIQGRQAPNPGVPLKQGSTEAEFMRFDERHSHHQLPKRDTSNNPPPAHETPQSQRTVRPITVLTIQSNLRSV